MRNDCGEKKLDSWLNAMLITIVIMLVIATILGFIGINNEYKVIYNSEEITLREKDGRTSTLKLVQNRSGQMFIAISEGGLFLDKRVTIDKDKNIIFEDVEYTDYINIKCKTIEDNWFLNDDLLNYDYTIVMNVATWSEECDKVLSELSQYREQLEKENVQLVGVIVDEVTDKNTKKIVKKVNKKIEKYGLDIDFLIPTQEMKEQLQTNMKFIPDFKILSKDSKIVAEVSSEYGNLNTVLNKIKELKSKEIVLEDEVVE